MLNKLCLMIITIFAFKSFSYADKIDSPHIIVFGTAVQQVTPDTMAWSIFVKNKGQKLQEVATRSCKISF